MTVSNPTRAVTFTGNGVTTVFPYTFLIPANTAVVTLTTIATDLEGDALTEGVDYSITGEDNEAGGNVTYPLSGSPLASTHKINIKSILTPEQTLDLTNQSAYNPTQLETQLDKMTLVQLQQAEQLARAVLVASGSSISSDELLEEFSAVPGYAVAAAADAAAASASASAAAASALAAAASETAADADRVTVAADKATVAADKATVAADKATVAADKALVAADKAAVDVAKAATDVNVAATAADVISTAADVVLTHADVVLAEAAKVAAEAAAGSLTPVKDQVVAGTDKATPADTDLLAVVETAGPVLRKSTWANIKAAIWTALGELINGGTDKATPANADMFAIADSAASNATKKLTWTNLRAALNTYFNALGSLTLAAGDVLYASGVNTLARLAKGTAGQVLTMNAGATAPEWATPSATGGATVMTAVATTSGAGTTGKSFAIPSGAKKITLTLNGVSLSSAFSMYVRLGDAGGVESTGYVNKGTSIAGTTITTMPADTTYHPLISTGFDIGATNKVYGTVEMTLINSSTFTWAIVSDVTADVTAANYFATGIKALSQELSTITLYGSAGNFDLGEIGCVYIT